MQTNFLGTILKGIGVGGTMLVPGVSGGSMAMILGVYDKLVSSVSSFTKHKQESMVFLSLFTLGGIAGMILFATPLMNLIERYPMPMLYFFIGAVAGGIPMMYQKAEVQNMSWKVLLYLAIGILAVMLFAKLPTETFETVSGSMEILLLVGSGFVAAIALVLPGISVSYMLLLMGTYDQLMKAIGGFQLRVLIPMGIGVLLGIVLTTKLLETAMTRFPQPTYVIILGFILGSVFQIFPGFPTGLQWVVCIFMLLLGYAAIRLLSWNETKAVVKV